MAKPTVADYLLTRLREWGTEYVFGYPGDGINGLLAAWGKADNQPRFIQARHEEMAAFQAVGYAKFSGRPGICVATSGPGAIHLLNGLYDAKLDHVPVVAIVGQTARSAIGGSYQQEVDLTGGDRSARPVAAVRGAEQLLEVLLAARVEHRQDLVAGLQHGVWAGHEALALAQDRDQQAACGHRQVADPPPGRPRVLAEQHLDDLQLLLLQVEQVDEPVLGHLVL